MGKIIVSEDITDAMKAEVIAEEVLLQATPQYNLRKLCRVLPFGNRIEGKFPIQTNLEGQEKVGELVEAELSALSFVDLDFSLWKNVVHVAQSKESKLRSIHDIMKMSAMDAARDMARMENKQIAEEMVSSTAFTSAGVWSTSTNNPLDDILTGITTLNDNGYNPQYLAMPPAVYKAFAVSPFIVDAYIRGSTVTGMIPSVLGLEIVIDPQLTAKTAWILDQKAPAFALADGPELIEKYPGGPAFYDGWAIADFLEPKQVLAAASRKVIAIS